MKTSRRWISHSIVLAVLILFFANGCGKHEDDDKPVLISISISGQSEVDENSDAQYKAEVEYSNGTKKNVTDIAIWEVDNPDYTSIGKGKLTIGEIPYDTDCNITVEFTEGKTKKSTSFGIVLLNKLPQLNYKLYGLCVGLYLDIGENPNSGTVLTENEIRDRLAKIAFYTIWVRSFGSSLGMENFARIAKQEFGLKVAAGAWLSGNATADAKEIANLIAAAKAGYVDIAIIGSETLLRNDLTATQLINYINQFKAAVPGVKVTTSDVYNEFISHPAVITACDILFANYYPFWDGNNIEQAIASLNANYLKLKAVAGGKEIVVSETGWPSDGDQKIDAVPSLENAAFYFLNFISWTKVNNVSYFYFEGYDEPWKSAYELLVGDHWGLFFTDGIMKPGMEKVFNGETIPDNWTVDTIPGGEGDATITAVYSNGYLVGKVLHVDPDEYCVGVYIKVRGNWWIKPYWAYPKTVINPDGSWTCDVITGGVDEEATDFAIGLFPADYVLNSSFNQTTFENDAIVFIYKTK